jgi:hypothetical protein
MNAQSQPRLLRRAAAVLSVVSDPRSITLGTQIGDKPVDPKGFSGDERGITGGCHVEFTDSSQAGYLLSAFQQQPPVDPARHDDLGKQQISTLSTDPTTTTRLQILA